jgi:hypothetical protein
MTKRSNIVVVTLLVISIHFSGVLAMPETRAL